MPDTLSTLDVPARWVGESQDPHQQQDTRFFFSSQMPWDLLFHEAIQQERLGFQSEPLALAPENLTHTQGLQAQEPRTRIPRAKRMSAQPDGRYILLKKYEGFVTSRTEGTFRARLFENITDYPVLEAEFALEELSESDRGLAAEGAAMVWTIGYRYEGSTRKRESMIYFRRLPQWTEKEIDQAKQSTEELTREIEWQ